MALAGCARAAAASQSSHPRPCFHPLHPLITVTASQPRHSGVVCAAAPNQRTQCCKRGESLRAPLLKKHNVKRMAAEDAELAAAQTAIQTVPASVFSRYHRHFTHSAKGKAALQEIGLEYCHDASISDDDGQLLLVGTADGDDSACDRDALKAEQLDEVVVRVLGKSVGGNHWVGFQLAADTAFRAEAERVHAEVMGRCVSGGDGDDDQQQQLRTTLQQACLPAARWSLCLMVLRIYSPAALEQVTCTLREALPGLMAETGAAGAWVRTLRFSGLRCLGPSKLVATLCEEDAARLRPLVAGLHAKLSRWAEQPSSATVPHVSLVKFSWPVGNKKAKAASAAAAKRLALHKLDWSGVSFDVAAHVGPVRVLAMHLQGGAAMAPDEPYPVAATVVDPPVLEDSTTELESRPACTCPALELDDALAQQVFKHLDCMDCLNGASLTCRQWGRQCAPIRRAWKEEFVGSDLLHVSGLC